MTNIKTLSLLGAAMAVLAACAQQPGAPGDSGKGGDGGYYSPGTKGVTDRQADWISRTHTPPAGR